MKPPPMAAAVILAPPTFAFAAATLAFAASTLALACTIASSSVTLEADIGVAQ
eukprot:CAMPEP_0119065468 /NCGR_PEP_ID=MMETSP1178-20130426/8279_1 /TAXON_ID=33656 /ORGANISM="unid sp, Strain CCMP2000" /LENGTH=52 /DNA_ID=CAMNT_0007046989 /DNA_START=154 /DNA_END=312 /DNA_ORIENTATION=-